MPRKRCDHTLVHDSSVIRLLPVFFPLGYDTRPLGITFASCRSIRFFDCGSWCYSHPVTPARRLLSSDMLVCVCHVQRLQPFGVVIADPMCAYFTLHTRSVYSVHLLTCAVIAYELLHFTVLVARLRVRDTHQQSFRSGAHLADTPPLTCSVVARQPLSQRVCSSKSQLSGSHTCSSEPACASPESFSIPQHTNNGNVCFDTPPLTALS